MKKRSAVTLTLSVFLIIIYAGNIYPFLAITKRVPATILVVEGSLRFNYSNQAVTEFKAGKYDKIITIGGQLFNNCSDGLCFTEAEHKAKELKSLGIADSLVIAVPSLGTHYSKTFSAYQALGKWIQNNQPDIKSLNIFTATTHARKSYMLGRKALGDSIQVGVISGNTDSWDPEFWWLDSHGISIVIKNTFGYLFALYIVYLS
jgi:hypothetical protein